MNRTDKWMEHYNLAKDYYDKHGSLTDISNYTVNNFNVGFWVRNQRRTYLGKGKCRLYKWQIELLDKIDIRWNFNDDTWSVNYNLVKDYYKEHKNTNIPRSYKVNDVNLGAWLNSQKYNHNVKSKLINGAQIKLLNEVEVDWHPHCTSLLKKEITSSIKKKYYEKLSEITLEYLDDLKYEDINEIDSKETQKHIEDKLIRRIFR